MTLVARNEAKLKQALDELSSSGGQKHNYLVADFNFADQLREVVAKSVKNKAYHILINNTVGPPAGLAIDAQPDDFIKAFTNHLLCNQLLVQAVVPGMKKSAMPTQAFQMPRPISPRLEIIVPWSGLTSKQLRHPLA